MLLAHAIANSLCLDVVGGYGSKLNQNLRCHLNIPTGFRPHMKKSQPHIRIGFGIIDS